MTPKIDSAFHPQPQRRPVSTFKPQSSKSNYPSSARAQAIWSFSNVGGENANLR